MTDTVPALPEGWTPMRIGGLWSAIGPLLARRATAGGTGAVAGPKETEERGGAEAGWRYGLMTDERHANPLGLIHGGTLTALMDHAMTLVAFEANDRRPAVTVQMETRFLAGARPGDLLEAETRLDRQTGSLIFLSCRLTAGGAGIATGSAIMKTARKTSTRENAE